MRAIFLACLLVLSVWSQSCGKGGIACNKGECHYPSYIEGCLTYGLDNACSVCEYSTFLSI